MPERDRASSREVPSLTEFFDRQGKPLDLLDWAALYEDDDYRLLRCTDLGTYVVTTIWRGFDTGLRPKPIPLIFEVAVFAKIMSDDPQECSGQTYQFPDEATALAAHDWTCTQLMSVDL